MEAVVYKGGQFMDISIYKICIYFFPFLVSVMALTLLCKYAIVPFATLPMIWFCCSKAQVWSSHNQWQVAVKWQVGYGQHIPGKGKKWKPVQKVLNLAMYCLTNSNGIICHEISCVLSTTRRQDDTVYVSKENFTKRSAPILEGNPLAISEHKCYVVS